VRRPRCTRRTEWLDSGRAAEPSEREHARGGVNRKNADEEEAEAVAAKFGDDARELISEGLWCRGAVPVAPQPRVDNPEGI
jgi:hypothetical protein